MYALMVACFLEFPHSEPSLRTVKIPCQFTIEFAAGMSHKTFDGSTYIAQLTVISVFLAPDSRAIDAIAQRSRLLW